MNLSTSKTASSSCKCTTTLNGKHKESKKGLNTIQRQLLIMLACFFVVIGLSWGLDQKRNGTELTLADMTEMCEKKWSFLGPGSEKKRYGTHSDKPDGSWYRMAEK